MAKNGKKTRRPRQADTADKHRLYQISVQDPKAEIAFLDTTYRHYRRRRPLSMKEDFCGTAHLSTAWVKSHKGRTAIGVDLHEPTLEYALEHNVAPEKRSVRDRIQLLTANVLEVTEPQVDLTCALNFSYCVFKTRALLRRYFEVAHQGLNDEGVFFCELFGGTEAIVTLEEKRKLKGFTYVWDQAKYNPITNEILCHIHFDFPDGSRMKKAFTYDWRLWTIPEVRECLLEAGFSRVDVYWDPVEGDPKGDEYYRITEEEENQEGWLVYLVAVK
jgi:hypothetical protein